jgi:methionyl-tRNA formyltransferase
MKIIFLGTPEIAKVCLNEILKSEHQVLAVVTKPDKPAGRGKKLQMSPVKEFALEKNIPVYQFKNINQEGFEILKNFKPDVLVLVAFGQILKQDILNIALPINLHGSLLPKYRGPSPIQTAILKGEKETGVSIIKMVDEVDAGDILLQKKVSIDNDDTSGSLFEKIADAGAKAIVESLDLINKNKIVFVPQEHEKATYTLMLTKENSKLDFNDTLINIINKIRAYNPSPVAFFELDNVKYKVYKAKICDDANIVSNNNKTFSNGEIVCASTKQGLIIKTADGFIEILEIQYPNSNKLDAKTFLNGRKLVEGSIIK